MKKVTLLLLLVLAAMAVVGSGVPAALAANETIYTSVLTDLQQDKTFDVNDYPAKLEDYSLSVIQIAESSAGELFVYVYAPQGEKVVASEIRISTELDDNFAPKDYKLMRLSASGTLAKYIVVNFRVKYDAERYYSIIQIARPWNKAFGDKTPEGNNTASTTAYAVEKLFTAKTTEKDVTYTEEHADAVEITSKYIGQAYYLNDGNVFVSDWTVSHVVIFSTNVRIDKIFDIDVTFDLYHCTGIVSEPWKYSVSRKFVETISKTIYSDDTDSNNPVSHWWVKRKKFTWNSIQSTNEFAKEFDTDEETTALLQKEQWVLRVHTSDFHYTATGNYGDWYETREITLLRIHYIANGNVYNLGVVDNKQSGKFNFDPSEVFKKPKAGLPWWAYAIIAGVALIVIVWIASKVKKRKRNR